MSEQKEWPDLQCYFTRASFELACPGCFNRGHITNASGEKDECPKCHGHGRNKNTLELLGALVSHAERAALLRAQASEQSGG